MGVLLPDLTIKTGRDKNSKVLRHKLIMPPFSVLDARQGYWQDRKKAWISLGIKSEVGRGDCLLYGEGSREPGLNFYRDKEKEALLYKNQDRLNAIMKDKGPKAKKLRRQAEPEPEEEKAMVGTSIFDPVLCEIIYSWFVPASGLILDPFAGGSVRGIVAHKLGFSYVGIELSKEQVKANEQQAKEIVPDSQPQWWNGDSRNLNKLMGETEFDFVFSCPPYFDLEVYSSDPRDLSTMTYIDFRKAYFDIIEQAVSHLKDNRFACFVVAEVRDKKTGFLRSFVQDTIRGFLRAGMEFYNDAIFVTPVGSLPIRTANSFKTRKLGKTHQNVLIFYKGDISKIKDNFEESI